ncbi:DUF1080 domain-containing protein [candidate division KSB1 bacterium]|nr:DUF1080 domain-containing protein [candidate division KSB1 bacterium]
MYKKRMLLVIVIAFVSIFCVTVCSEFGSRGWILLFDGKTLEGWKISENPGSARVEEGVMVCNGPRAHVFYAGKVHNANFKNFELKVDVKTKPGTNSGIYFHTAYQEEGWPTAGYEVQVNNSQEEHDGYYEFKKTGSLYGIRNIYKQLVADNEWFNMHIIVKEQRIQVNLNGDLVVDFIQPENDSNKLRGGTFAFQCHDPNSTAYFKNIRVKPLPDDIIAEKVELPLMDSVYVQILQLSRDNFPLIDFHAHLKGGLTLDDILAKTRRDGINYGIAPNCGVGFPIKDDKGIEDFLKTMQDQTVFIGMQAEGREWVDMFSREAIAKFDYVFTDAMTFTDNNGKRIRLWIKDEVDIKDKQAFMDMYVEKILGVLNDEPIDIYVNPTFLPEVIRNEYDQLWTPERMLKVIDAAVKNDVAIEINDRYLLPSSAFIKIAKMAGAKFSFGTNNGGKDDLGRLEYCLEMIKECSLTNRDMFMPKPDGMKKAQVK